MNNKTESEILQLEAARLLAHRQSLNKRQEEEPVGQFALPTDWSYWQRWQAKGGGWQPVGDPLPTGYQADPPGFAPLRDGEELFTPAFPAQELELESESVDVVIPYRLENDGTELRYCLRSLVKNLIGLGRIFLVGERLPSWLRPDGQRLVHLPVPDICRIADVSIWHKLFMACLEVPGKPKLSDRFVFVSDDQVFLRPISVKQLGPYHYGDIRNLSPVYQEGWWARLRYTGEYLRQHGKTTLHGDVHAPILMERNQVLRIMAETAWRPAPGLCVGSLYLNWTDQATKAQPMGPRIAVVSKPMNSAELHRELAGRWFLVHTAAGWNTDLQKLLNVFFSIASPWEKLFQLSTAISSPTVPVGVLSYALHMGGAERWTLDLVKFWDDQKIQFLGFGLEKDAGHPSLLREAKMLGPVNARYNPSLWQDVPNRIVVTWGPVPPLAQGTHIFVSHSSGQYAQMLVERVKNKVTYYAAVSPVCAEACPNPAATTIILNGVNLDRCRPIIGREVTRRKWGILSDQIAIGYLGRIGTDPRKNLMVIAQAATEYGERLVPIFIGAVLAERAKQEILSVCPRAVFVEGCPHVGDALAALDCLILASKAEGCSLALLEAWAAGTPTVVTPVGAVPYFDDTYGQFAVPVSIDCSPKELIQAIFCAIAPDNRLRIQRAQEVIRGLYNSYEFGRRWTEYLCAVYAGIVSPDHAFVPSEEMVSVVTTVYNTSPEYLQECWQSLQQQTWKHWEWIVVDDGSAQSATVEKLQQIARDPRVRLIHLPEHRGVAAAANIGLREARYELIARIDSDDIAKPTWLARMVAFMKAHPEIDIGGCQIEIFDDVTKVILERSQHPQHCTHDFIMQQVAAHNVWFLNHPGVFYRRQKIREIGWYDESLPAHIDQDLWLRAYAAGLQIANISDSLIYYRRHANQLGSRQPHRELTDRITQAFRATLFS